MIKLLFVFIASIFLAYCSERNTKAVVAGGQPYSVWHDWAYVMLVVLLTLFAGLRTSYNDTQNYIRGFDGAPLLSEFLRNPENLNPFKNPLFSFFQSLLKSWTIHAQWLIFISAAFTQICFIRFFKRYSKSFIFSVFIYFTLGTFAFTLTAIKQVLGMSILTLAFPYLEKKKWGRFYLFVLLAMLVHTYAIAFAVLPLFQFRPWRLFTFIFISVTAAVMMNFEAAITAFMEQANDLGKTLADYEVFDDATINVFRLAVYAVPPLISFIFQKWIFHKTNDIDHVLVHMSIISLTFMAMGTQAGANMFGRMGNYFELGTICCLPAMLKKTFTERSYRLISVIACACFFVFFFYANAIHIDFGQEYRSTDLLSLFLSN